MSHNDLLEGYFEGELASYQETMLFDELPRNPELRRKFNEYQKLSSSLKHYAGHMTVPGATTNELFARLGISEADNPRVAPIVPPVPAGGAAAGSGARRLVSYGLTALASIAITSMALVWLTNSDADHLNDKGFSAETLSLENAASASSTGEPSSAAIAEFDNRRAAASEFADLEQRTDAAAVDRPSAGHAPSEDAPLERHPAARNQATAASSGIAAVVEASPNHKGHAAILHSIAQAQGLDKGFAPGHIAKVSGRAAPISSVPADHLPAYVSAIDVPAFLSDFSFEVSKLTGISNPDASANTDDPKVATKNELTDNLSYGLYYRLSDNFSIGALYGSEQFGQIFSFVNNEGRLLEYQQNPVLQWGGLAFRVNVPQLLLPQTLFPYAQLSAAYADTDALLLRGEMGLRFEPTKWLNVGAGLHYGELQYSVGGGDYKSIKRGFALSAGFRY